MRWVTRFEDEEFDRLFSLRAQQAAEENVQSEAARATAVGVGDNWAEEIKNA